MKGIVKWFQNTKGYGFISQQGGDDLFVHQSQIKEDGFRTLTEGQAVEFEIGENEKGKHAINVRKISK
jgi:CspA family cold shock protein